jgi:hypothetical protein
MIVSLLFGEFGQLGATGLSGHGEVLWPSRESRWVRGTGSVNLVWLRSGW